MPREGDGTEQRVINGLPIPDRFSDSFLRKLKCPPDRKEITLFEKGGTGLAVRVQTSGVISLLLQHRLRDGRRLA